MQRFHLYCQPLWSSSIIVDSVWLLVQSTPRLSRASQKWDSIGVLNVQLFVRLLCCAILPLEHAWDIFVLNSLMDLQRRSSHHATRRLAMPLRSNLHYVGSHATSILDTRLGRGFRVDLNTIGKLGDRYGPLHPLSAPSCVSLLGHPSLATALAWYTRNVRCYCCSTFVAARSWYRRVMIGFQKNKTKNKKQKQNSPLIFDWNKVICNGTRGIHIGLTYDSCMCTCTRSSSPLGGFVAA